MFCGKCGKEISGNSKYCDECMAENNQLNQNPNITTENNYNTNQSYAPQYIGNNSVNKSSANGSYKMCCPSCKSRNLQMVTNTEFHSQTKGGGFSAGKGCCGYIAFGPLGLLCGACGSKSKTTISSSSTNVWVCHDCGNRFRDLNEIDKDIVDAKKRKKIGVIALTIMSIIFIAIPLFFMITVMFSGLGISEGFSFIIEELKYFAVDFLLSAFCAIMAFLVFKSSQNRISHLEEERYYIQTTAFKYE